VLISLGWSRSYIKLLRDICSNITKYSNITQWNGIGSESIFTDIDGVTEFIPYSSKQDEYKEIFFAVACQCCQA
jgi:hypothetical protein